MFFRLNSLELGLIVFGIVLGTTLLGAYAGHHLRTRSSCASRSASSRRRSSAS